MNLDENAKEAVHELGEAINAAIEKSTHVKQAIQNLRDIGYEPNLSLRLEIGLQELIEHFEEDSNEIELDLTDEDMRTLRRMKIKL